MHPLIRCYIETSLRPGFILAGTLAETGGTLAFKLSTWKRVKLFGI
jgi:hypothetical protein